MKALDRTLEAWGKETRSNLEPKVLDLIRGANWDLYNGPLSVEDAEAQGIKDWPGFGKATEQIREALDDVREMFVDTESETWSTSEPEDYGFGYWRVERRDLLRALVGRELVEYVK